MRPIDRYHWIADWIAEFGNAYHLNREFSDAYIEAVKPNLVGFQPYGAHNVPQLRRDLCAMFKLRYLKRYRSSISGFYGMGFPNWVFSYGKGRRFEDLQRPQPPEASNE